MTRVPFGNIEIDDHLAVVRANVDDKGPLTFVNQNFPGLERSRLEVASGVGQRHAA